ncbi:universal stress protein [Saccharopolyspora subtropica]|uniref:Universal stress protein n=1 Tax=Saccharopolyspora thermophila TaxID=89367 RepID=A0A917JYU8_9PSEU|nr:universal stress protein [Saccharopolyspora subtropica]GGI91311.1 universal stress protein [Saccharopolyspora subtropica]
MSNGAHHKIVVGVDGSESSRNALRWALQQAALTGAVVHAVCAWEFPAFYSWEGGPLPPDDFEESARRSLDDAVDEVERETGPPAPIERHLTHGHAAQALLDAAADADLLVVGSRGHGSFYGALLGSVSQRCAVHAQCPVVIVRR